MSVATHLGLGHVQQTHRVTVTVEESSDCVQGLVELPLYVCELFKHLAGRPQQHLDNEEEYKTNHIFMSSKVDLFPLLPFTPSLESIRSVSERSDEGQSAPD